MKDEYPILNKDIYFAKVKTGEGTTITVENLLTTKDYRVNSGTAAFLELCTGSYSLVNIAKILAQKSGEPVDDILQGVEKISAVLQKKGLITIKETPLKKIFEKNPAQVLKKAIMGMLPKNKLRAKRIKRLKFE